MSVRIKYLGRFGNNVFQYMAGRLFADENAMELETPFPGTDVIPILPQTSLPVAVSQGAPIRLGDPDAVLDRRWPAGNYVLEGFFQRPDWYYARKEAIWAFARPSLVMKDHADDIVMHVRHEDYFDHRIVISPSWYLRILRKELTPFRKLFIVGKDLDQGWLEAFHEYRPEIVSGSPKEDFDFLRRFDRVLLSNSTFAWWSVFFSRPAVVYTFRKWIGNAAAPLAEFPGAVPVNGKFTWEV